MPMPVSATVKRRRGVVLGLVIGQEFHAQRLTPPRR